MQPLTRQGAMSTAVSQPTFAWQKKRDIIERAAKLILENWAFHLAKRITLLAETHRRDMKLLGGDSPWLRRSGRIIERLKILECFCYGLRLSIESNGWWLERRHTLHQSNDESAFQGMWSSPSVQRGHAGKEKHEISIQLSKNNTWMMRGGWRWSWLVFS